MQKSKLVNFIDKYNLKETVETVAIEVNNNQLSTKFVDDIGGLKGNVTYKNFNNDDVKFGVYDTKMLKKFINILDEEIDVDVQTNSNQVDAIIFNDSNKIVKFIPCDLSIVPVVPPFVAALPTKFSINIENISDSFIDDFVKSESVINDSDSFDIKYNSTLNMYEIIFGFSSDSDTNNIKFPIPSDVDETDLIDRVKFKSSYVREILLANKNMSVKTMRVHTAGLIIFTFESDDYICNYYLQSLSE